MQELLVVEAGRRLVFIVTIPVLHGKGNQLIANSQLTTCNWCAGILSGKMDAVI